MNKYGNEHIIVIIDCFSHFVMLYATKDATAILAAKAQLLHCIGMFGVPIYILSDNGPQYELIYLMGSDHHQLTTAYIHIKGTLWQSGLIKKSFAIVALWFFIKS